MVPDTISYSLTGDAGHPDWQARRCVQCGRVIDSVILQNRRLQVEKNLAGLISAVKLVRHGGDIRGGTPPSASE